MKNPEDSARTIRLPRADSDSLSLLAGLARQMTFFRMFEFRRFLLSEKDVTVTYITVNDVVLLEP